MLRTPFWPKSQGTHDLKFFIQKESQKALHSHGEGGSNGSGTDWVGSRSANREENAGKPCMIQKTISRWACVDLSPNHCGWLLLNGMQVWQITGWDMDQLVRWWRGIRRWNEWRVNCDETASSKDVSWLPPHSLVLFSSMSLDGKILLSVQWRHLAPENKS